MNGQKVMLGTRSRITGTGSSLPVRRVENREVAELLGIEPSYIFRVSGIKTRYWAGPQEECSFLAEQATRKALDQAGLVPQDLDAILFSSTSPEMVFPSTACLLQDRMDIRGIPAFDFAASCSGFLYGLSMADSLIRAGQFRRCLVVASEIKSRSLDFNDLSTAILFGDGAGAAIVERSIDSHFGIMSIQLHADGHYHDLVKISGGGSRLPLSQDILNSRGHTLRIRGSQLFRIAIQRLGQAVHHHLEREKLVVSQLDQVVFHQANGRMLNQFCKKLGIPSERCLTMIDEVGNTSSASLPMALDRANRDHRLEPGHLLMLGAFGGGLTWGTALVRWG